jgi:hypothetical protein
MRYIFDCIVARYIHEVQMWRLLVVFVTSISLVSAICRTLGGDEYPDGYYCYGNTVVHCMKGQNVSNEQCPYNCEWGRCYNPHCLLRSKLKVADTGFCGPHLQNRSDDYIQAYIIYPQVVQMAANWIVNHKLSPLNDSCIEILENMGCQLMFQSCASSSNACMAAANESMTYCGLSNFSADCIQYLDYHWPKDEPSGIPILLTILAIVFGIPVTIGIVGVIILGVSKYLEWRRKRLIPSEDTELIPRP